MKNRKKSAFLNNKGFTLVEMIVTFALLSIFIASAAVIIGTTTSMYYDIKGENYSKQVTDIIMEKIESEIDGAFYDSAKEASNLRIQTVSRDDTEESLDAGKAVVLSDKNGAKIKMFAENGELVVHYFDVGSLKATDWKFDKNVYKYFSITDLYFVRGDKLDTFSNAADYGLTDYGTYGSDVIVVFLKMHHPVYGDYKAFRFVKMYNASGI
ncbi:MAG: prepilin-type N-terminal cleavage/methylation domain-containing protein [Eubacterium sp.]|nr:prepilin-type N-terminal cleavage/methylation domain-containing protein [Eubacterium sp.]